MKKTLLIYVVISLIITLGTLYYQDNSGPTQEKKVNVELNGVAYHFELPRSHDIVKPCIISLEIPDTSVSAIISYRRYPTDEKFITDNFLRNGNLLEIELPRQPKAGKLEYSIVGYTSTGKVAFTDGERVVIRFKGHVPTTILVIHILLMFISYFFSIFAGLLALFNQRKYQFYALIALILLGLGGFWFGPWVQWYAFDAWWAGWPNGTDLTDNKLLIAFLAWLIAWIFNIKKPRRWLAVVAMVIHIVVYSIPHSARGSEYNYESGQIETTDKFRDN